MSAIRNGLAFLSPARASDKQGTTGTNLDAARLQFRQIFDVCPILGT